MSDDEQRRNYSDEEGEDVGYDDSDRDDDDSEEEEDDEEEIKRVRISTVCVVTAPCSRSSALVCPNAQSIVIASSRFCSGSDLN